MKHLIEAALSKMLIGTSLDEAISYLLDENISSAHQLLGSLKQHLRDIDGYLGTSKVSKKTVGAFESVKGYWTKLRVRHLKDSKDEIQTRITEMHQLLDLIMIDNDDLILRSAMQALEAAQDLEKLIP